VKYRHAKIAAKGTINKTDGNREGSVIIRNNAVAAYRPTSRADFEVRLLRIIYIVYKKPPGNPAVL
jgi:hypothetical protein